MDPGGGSGGPVGGLLEVVLEVLEVNLRVLELVLELLEVVPGSEPLNFLNQGCRKQRLECAREPISKQHMVKAILCMIVAATKGRQSAWPRFCSVYDLYMHHHEKSRSLSQSAGKANRQSRL